MELFTVALRLLVENTIIALMDLIRAKFMAPKIQEYIIVNS